jgi:hypothetical protein
MFIRATGAVEAGLEKCSHRAALDDRAMDSSSCRRMGPVIDDSQLWFKASVITVARSSVGQRPTNQEQPDSAYIATRSFQ